MKHGNNPTTAIAFVNYEEMSGSNFYALGDICKSYNTVIASHTNGVILLNACDYSNTTQRHKLHIRRAAKRLTLFEVPIVYRWNGLTKEEHRKNLEYLQENAESLQRKAAKARTARNIEIYTQAAEDARESAKEYADIFEL